jgi:hypothetical protein
VTAARHDAKIPAGDRHSFVVTLTDEDGAAVDLAGATARLVVYVGDTVKVDDRLAATGSGDGPLTVVGLRIAGQLRVLLTPADTANLSGSYEFEVKVKLADGRVDQVAVGQLSFTRSRIGADV